MFDRLGRAIVRAPLVVVAAWIVLAAVCLLLAPALTLVGSADETSFLPADAESVRARDLAARAFPDEASASSATLVLHRPAGLEDGDRAYLADLAGWLVAPGDEPRLAGRIDGLTSAADHPELAGQLRSADGTTEMATVRLSVAAFQQGANEAVAAIRDRVAATVPAGLEVHVTGSAGIGADYLAAIVQGTDRTTFATVILVLLILLAIYRAPLAALVPLLTIGVAFLVSRGALGWVAEAGVKVSTLIDSFVVVLVFGVGTDYTIFLISRYREELARTPDGGRSAPARALAARRTVGRIGAVIAASAGTVVVGLVSMAVARFGLIQTTGPALALAIAVTLAAGMTLAPALLVLFGPALFWPRHPKPLADEAGTSAWGRIASAIVRRPWTIAAGVAAALALPAVLLPPPTTNFDMLAELPPGADARVGFERVAEHLERGRLLPVVVYLERPAGDVVAPAALALQAKATAALEATPGVAQVRSIVAPAGEGVAGDLRPSTRLRKIADQVGLLAGPGAVDLALRSPTTVPGLQAAAAWLRALVGGDTVAAGDPAGPAAADAMSRLEVAVGSLVAGAQGSAATAAKAEAAAAAAALAEAARTLVARYEASPDEDWYLPVEVAGESGAQVGQLLAAFVGADRAVARLTVIVADDPYSSAAANTVGRVRAALAGLATSDGSRFLVGGAPAEFTDVHETIADDFTTVAAITVAGILAVLVLLLRSLVAPVYLVATVLLSYLTSLHLAGAVFEDLLGQAGTNTYLPLLVFVLLVALGSDYNIFVTSRIREESAAGDLRAGIRTASVRTGTVVTSAGIILAGTFGSLTTAPLQILFQVGFAVALGVLIDTFVVRSILVPALAAAFGEWSWWPSRRRRAAAPPPEIAAPAG